MRCPNCGDENPNDAQRCASCGLALTVTETDRSGQQAKISGMAVCAAALEVLAMGLAAFVKPTLAFFAALFSLSSSVAAIRQIRNRTNSKGKGLAIAAVVFSSAQMILLSYWRIDAAPILDDYTISDIKSASTQYNQTYDLLKSLGDGDEWRTGAPMIGLSVEDVRKSEEINNIFKEHDLQLISERLVQHEQEILSIWQKAKKGRDIFAKLDSYPEIADLKGPDFETEGPWVIGLRRLIFLYRAYICLQSCQGNHQTALDELMKLDSIVRKMSLTARSILMKLVCFAWLTVDIQAANFVVNNPQTPHDILLVLKRHTSTLSKEHTSLRNVMIYDYLSLKNHLMRVASEPRLRYSAFSTLKANSTLRLLRNFFDKFIALDDPGARTEEFRFWPNLYPNLPASIVPGNKLPSYYRLYNPAGSQIVEIITPATVKLSALRTRLDVHSDLLQIVLDKRLGREVSLKARAYSDEYIVDVENKKIFSPGPDDKPGTKDDISLPINPGVLGW